MVNAVALGLTASLRRRKANLAVSGRGVRILEGVGENRKVLWQVTASMISDLAETHHTSHLQRHSIHRPSSRHVQNRELDDEPTNQG